MKKWKILKAELPVLALFFSILPTIVGGILLTFPISDKNQLLIMLTSSVLVVFNASILLVAKLFFYLKEKFDAQLKLGKEHMRNLFNYTLNSIKFSPFIILLVYLLVSGFSKQSIIYGMNAFLLFSCSFIYVTLFLFFLMKLDRYFDKKIQELESI